MCLYETKDTSDEKRQVKDTRIHVTLQRSKLDKKLSRRRTVLKPAVRIEAVKRLSTMYDRPDKEPELNVLIRDKLSFVGVARLTRGG